MASNNNARKPLGNMNITRPSASTMARKEPRLLMEHAHTNAPATISEPQVNVGAPSNNTAKAVVSAPTLAQKQTMASMNKTIQKPVAGRPAVTTASAASMQAKRKRPESTTVGKPISGAPLAKKATISVPVAVDDGATKNGKRAAWDIKGRLQDLESFTESLKSKIRDANENVSMLQNQLTEKETVVCTLAETKEVLQQDLSQYQRQIDEANRARQELMRLVDRLKEDSTTQCELLNSRIRAKEMELENLNVRHRILEEDAAKYRRNILELEHSISTFKTEVAELTVKLQTQTELANERGAIIEKLESTITSQLQEIARLEAKAREDETIRRKLHNSIQELKGNIRVFCRVRPPLPKESGCENFNESFYFPDGNSKRSLEIVCPQQASVTGGEKADKNYNFTFDKVFGPESTQAKVFEEISGLVQSALDGYNVCIFTYGQTGSGKTFTMEGPEEPDENSKGMIPRAVQQVFSSSKYLQEQGWDYTFQSLFLEIYNEEIRDLLTLNPNAATAKKHEVKHNKDGTTSVTEMTMVDVERPQQVHELLKRASRNRAVAATKCNERSSRSHSVFQLHIKGKNDITGESASGILSLVDLAGSERLKESGSTGQRLKETQNINKSLSCLGDVIAALANREQHIPYRNSKLTYLLQNSLGGNSKTLMFVNISPRVPDVNETLSSLRFATKVNACEIGVARKGGKVNFKD